MVWSDIDDTFIPWVKFNGSADEGKLERTRQALNRHADETVNGLCTSRSLGEVQSLAKDFLKGFPLKVLGVNGGQQIFLNHRDEPTQEWLVNLQSKDSDASWDNEVAVRSGGFRAAEVMGQFHTMLGDLGFRPSPQLPAPFEAWENFVGPLPGSPGQTAVVAIVPGQTSFALRAHPSELATPLSDEHRAYAHQLAGQLQQRLADQGVPLHVRDFPYKGNNQVLLFEPLNIDKQTTLAHVLGKFPSVTHVITAGDNTNDTMLLPEAYGSVPNYRVVSGDKPELREKMAGKPRTEYQDAGDLGPAIETHLQTIRQHP